MISLKTEWDPKAKDSVNKYGPAEPSGTVDRYKSEKHGEVEVSDPFSWLETPSGRREKWIKGENKLAHKFLGRNLHRSALEQRMGESFHHEAVSVFLV